MVEDWAQKRTTKPAASTAVFVFGSRLLLLARRILRRGRGTRRPLPSPIRAPSRLPSHPPPLPAPPSPPAPASGPTGKTPRERRASPAARTAGALGRRWLPVSPVAGQTPLRTELAHGAQPPFWGRPAFLGCGVAGGSWPEEGVWVGKCRAQARLPHGAARGLGGRGGHPEPAALPLTKDSLCISPAFPPPRGDAARVATRGQCRCGCRRRTAALQAGGGSFFCRSWAPGRCQARCFGQPLAAGARWQAASLAASFAFRSVFLNFLLEYFRV